jgi:hypothetical protein
MIDEQLRTQLVEYYRQDAVALSRFLDGKAPPWFDGVGTAGGRLG